MKRENRLSVQPIVSGRWPVWTNKRHVYDCGSQIGARSRFTPVSNGGCEAATLRVPENVFAQRSVRLHEQS